ncbi:hypothetical protein F4781DRAFT_52997 [Annulohypoxylon bovei var. microspora]|nr:hypothetical protein F4781DRAFT_52997 [Annulohypoxylon bovei var. microspora]
MEESNPPIFYLASLACSQPQVLQASLDKVEVLEFINGQTCHHRLFQDYTFPNLEALVLESSAYNNDDALIPYLQPKLKSLHFYGGPITDVTLERLQVCDIPYPT